MTTLEAQAPINLDQSWRKRWRCWALLAVVALLIAAIDIFAANFGDLDARGEFLLNGWSNLLLAVAIWILIDTKSWIKTAVVALLFIHSLADVTQGAGIWHAVCVEQIESSGSHSTLNYEYCLPSWGRSPAFD